MQVVFYEKPGCAGNARQKAWLRAAGHTVVARDLLAEPWDRARLLAFLGPLPVTAWFNPAAPAVKHGRIDPATLSADAALECLLAQPLLIRRPLMQGEDGCRMVGFDPTAVHAWIGLAGASASPMPAEGCAAQATPCPQTRDPPCPSTTTAASAADRTSNC